MALWQPEQISHALASAGSASRRVSSRTGGDQYLLSQVWPTDIAVRPICQVGGLAAYLALNWPDLGVSQAAAQKVMDLKSAFYI